MGEKLHATGWWLWGLVLLVITIAVLSVTNYIGLWGKTAMESVIFKESHQYKDARRSAIGTFEAQLVEINSQLSQDISAEKRANLESQAATIRVMLSNERNK